MIYSVGCEYAIRTLIKLARSNSAGGFVLLRTLIDSESMPEHFVGKLMQTLVHAEILVSAKGRGGGFALARPAGQITLRQIVSAIDGNERIDRCILGFASCDELQPCPQHDEWAPIRRQIGELLDHTTLEDLIKALEKKYHPSM